MHQHNSSGSRIIRQTDSLSQYNKLQMDKQSHSPPQPKNQRRKRKDPESRDFMCKCGKSYLSYAAAYTHVKNKHAGEKDYLEKIVKPDREHLKRGRPKEKKVFTVTFETEKLSIVEEAILMIHESMKKEKETENKIVLEGNEEQRPDELVRSYDELKASFGDPGVDLFFKQEQHGESAQNLIKFGKSLNKHFLVPTATKMIWFMNYLTCNCTNFCSGESKLKVDVGKLRELEKDASIHKLFEGNVEICKIVVESLEKWLSCLKRERLDEGGDDSYIAA